jgi:DNA modification methylase
LRTLPDSSVDAVVTDPPYGLAFNGRQASLFDLLGN